MESKKILFKVEDVDSLTGLLFEKVSVIDIIDSLVSGDIDKPLSANQGKELLAKIALINNLLSSDDTSLDELQEIVSYIKQNKSTLEALGITNIAGLQDALDLKLNISDAELTNSRVKELMYIADGSLNLDWFEDGVKKTARNWTGALVGNYNYKSNVRLSITMKAEQGLNIMFGFSDKQIEVSDGYAAINYCSYWVDGELYIWSPVADKHVMVNNMVSDGSMTVSVALVNGMFVIERDGVELYRTALDPVLMANGMYPTIVPLGNDAYVSNIEIDFPDSVGHKTYLYSKGDTVTVGTTAIDIFTTEEYLIGGGKGVDLHLSLPLRSSSTSWGGMYVQMMMKVNGGDWLNLGNGGYDGNVMHYSATSIATAQAFYTLDIPGNVDIPLGLPYTVQFKLRCKSYNYTTTVNGSHDINKTTNSMGEDIPLEAWASNQNYTTFTIKETRI